MSDDVCSCMYRIASRLTSDTNTFPYLNQLLAIGINPCLCSLFDQQYLFMYVSYRAIPPSNTKTVSYLHQLFTTRIISCLYLLFDQQHLFIYAPHHDTPHFRFEHAPYNAKTNTQRTRYSLLFALHHEAP